MKTMLTVCAFTLCITPVLRAQDTPKPPGQQPKISTMTSDETFRSYDANHDGFLTRDEILAKSVGKTASDAVKNRIADTFMKKDLDGDGKISKEEWDVAGRKANEAAFARLDSDKDGFITKEE